MKRFSLFALNFPKLSIFTVGNKKPRKKQDDPNPSMPIQTEISEKKSGTATKKA